MIDSHCHLAGPQFAADLEEVIARAREVGIQRCLVILGAEDENEMVQGRVVSDAWPEVRFAIGVHPHQAALFAEDATLASSVVASGLERTPGAVAIGEIGLDYHYHFAPREVQQAVFRAQLRLARERDLPVVLHTREAEDDTLRILAEEGGRALRGVFHCFTGDRAAARRALETGFYLSIPGIATFPKSTELRAVAAEVPDQRLLIETDSPYLAPVPFRGKRNEPAYVSNVLESVAAIRGVSRSDLGEQLVRNFDALFGQRG